MRKNLVRYIIKMQGSLVGLFFTNALGLSWWRGREGGAGERVVGGVGVEGGSEGVGGEGERRGEG